jgi:hypothetical protein
VAIGVGALAGCGAHAKIGSFDIAIPSDWLEVKRQPDLVTLRAPGGEQQLTLTLVTFSGIASFEDFRRLCAHRLEAERREVADGFVQSDAPFESQGSYAMYFSGADRRSARIFSGYFTLRDHQIFTLYLEGIGVSPEEHLNTFKDLITGIKTT